MIPGSGRSSGEGDGNPLQYSFQENPMDKGAWWATVHGVSESDTTSLSLSHNKELIVPKLEPGCLGLKDTDQTSQSKRKSTLSIHWKD